MTEKPVPTPESMECLCSDCEDSQGRCKAGLGCFSSLQPKGENKKDYVVKKGCIKNEMHFKVNCEYAEHPIVCCDANLCNWNITPPFPTEEPSKP